MAVGENLVGELIIVRIIFKDYLVRLVASYK